jgi:hypothetical protein
LAAAAAATVPAWLNQQLLHAQGPHQEAEQHAQAKRDAEAYGPLQHSTTQHVRAGKTFS